MDPELEEQLHSPDVTDPDSESVLLHVDIHEVKRQLDTLHAKLDRLIQSHNEVGENVAWLTANTQGLFQMFSNPELMSKMMSGMLGGGPGAARPPAES